MAFPATADTSLTLAEEEVILVLGFYTDVSLISVSLVVYIDSVEEAVGTSEDDLTDASELRSALAVYDPYAGEHAELSTEVPLQ